MRRQRWSDTDFDDLSWHDCHVHALEVREGDHGAGDLILGLGFLLEWLPPEDRVHGFLIAPAQLHFREVTGLRIAIDWATPTAALCPFSIDGIRRAPHEYTASMGTHRYAIDVSWPEGAISFVSGGFDQTLTGEPVRTREQSLTYPERRRSEAARRG